MVYRSELLMLIIFCASEDYSFFLKHRTIGAGAFCTFSGVHAAAHASAEAASHSLIKAYLSRALNMLRSPAFSFRYTELFFTAPGPIL